MRSARATLTLLLALAGTAVAAPREGVPVIVGPETVRLIESKVVMPRDANALADYDRFYMLRTFTPRGMTPRDVVEGRFMLRLMGTHFRKGANAVPGIPSAFTIKRGGSLPNVADGGCWVVTVFFDLGTARLVEINEDGTDETTLAVCNGVA